MKLAMRLLQRSAFKEAAPKPLIQRKLWATPEDIQDGIRNGYVSTQLQNRIGHEDVMRKVLGYDE